MTRPPFVGPLALSLVLIGFLAACTGDPWVDRRREAGSLETVGESTLDRVAICFAPGTSPDVLHALAAQECAKTGRTPRHVGTTRFQCRLTAPHRIYFDCV